LRILTERSQGVFAILLIGSFCFSESDGLDSPGAR
jgi:hypothetical protein